MPNSKHPEKTIIGPLVTEKSFAEREKNKYFFKVKPDADKIAIKNAVENIYDVDVEKVNTAKIPTKKRTRMGGVIEGHTPNYKKTIVTLKEGQKIESLEH